ncbi:LamG domain-containing protein [Halomonas sp.]|uniref:LamG domain-containing protein n=1 Tax=Halomonas sp. TaxID=1486246 RepID=UPI00298DACE5|nr:LamG domain-containing protein [Halomonas sp.]MDW7746595.1 LamG domain-containing protein [Halomonas sp.]
MGTRLVWKEANLAEDGHRVYRDTAPLDPDNLPAPLATLGADVTQYDDGDVVPGTTYYYRVTAFVGAVERVSLEKSVTTTESSVAPTLGEAVRFTMDDISGDVLPDNAGSNDGQIVNGVVTQPGKDGLALEFNGVDNYVQFGQAILPGLPGGFSISLWVKLAPGDTGCFLSRVDAVSTSIESALLFRYRAGDDGAGPLPDFRIQVPGNPDSTEGVFFQNVIDDGNWHHLVATYGETYGHRLYFDGQLDVESAEYDGPVQFDNNYFYLGRDYREGSTIKWQDPLSGLADQFRFYSRELDAHHVVRLFNEFSGVL